MAFSSSAVTVNATVTLLATGVTGTVHVRPTDGDIYVGGPDVTAANGMLVKQDETLDDEFAGSQGDALYGITASGDVAVRVLKNSR